MSDRIGIRVEAEKQVGGRPKKTFSSSLLRERERERKTGQDRESVEGDREEIAGERNWLEERVREKVRKRDGDRDIIEKWEGERDIGRGRKTEERK